MIQIGPKTLYLIRSDWGALFNYRLGGPEDPRGGRRLIKHSERVGGVQHHTVGVDPDVSKNVWETWDEVKGNARRVQQERPDLGGGYYDVPYNHLGYLMPEGQVAICEGRGFFRSGAHTAYKVDGVYLNISLIATGWCGDFENYQIDLTPWLPAINDWNYYQKQVCTSIQFVNKAHRDYGYLGPLNRTACCGHWLYSHLPEFTFAVPTPPQEEEEEMLKIVSFVQVGDKVHAVNTDGSWWQIANNAMLQSLKRQFPDAEQVSATQAEFDKLNVHSPFPIRAV